MSFEITGAGFLAVRRGCGGNSACAPARQRIPVLRLAAQPLQRLAQRVWDTHWPLGRTRDMHMGEPALCRRQLRTRAEDGDPIGHGAGPESLYRETGLDRFGKGDALEIGAVRLDDHPDALTGGHFEEAVLDQP